MSNIKICIPSYKRPNEVIALDKVTPENQAKYFWLCVRDEELEQYKENYPHCNYLNLGSEWLPTDNVRETRQRINEMMSGKILVIDDDCTLHRTKVVIQDWKGKPFHYMRMDSKTNTNDVLEELLEYMDTLMDEFPFGGIRNISHPRDARKYFPYKMNQVCALAVWFNLDMFDTNEMSYRHGPEMGEDTYMVLKWFDKGYDIPQICLWNAKNAKKVNSQEGGCSTLTNRGEVHDASTRKLVELFPHLCKLKKSETYGGTLAVSIKLKRDLSQKLF